MVEWLAGILRSTGASVGSMSDAAWLGLAETIGAALLGAVLALLLSAAVRRGYRRLSRRGAASPQDLPCRDARCGLREFSQEVEERLDAKLDRLAGLLEEADRVLLKVPDPSSARPVSQSGSRVAGGSSRLPEVGSGDMRRHGSSGESDLQPITEEERERVLVWAAEGRSPDAIAEASGLLRGEVDLILRLYSRESA